MTSQPPLAGTPPVIGTNIETAFLMHYLTALDRLQETFENPDTERPSLKFNLQLGYLLSLIPDRDRQFTIVTEMKQYRQQLEERGTCDEELDYYVGFFIVTEIIKFLNSSLDLTHTDILGSVTDSPVNIDEYTPGIKQKDERTTI